MFFNRTRLGILISKENRTSMSFYCMRSKLFVLRRIDEEAPLDGLVYFPVKTKGRIRFGIHAGGYLNIS